MQMRMLASLRPPAASGGAKVARIRSSKHWKTKEKKRKIDAHPCHSPSCPVKADGQSPKVRLIQPPSLSSPPPPPFFFCFFHLSVPCSHRLPKTKTQFYESVGVSSLASHGRPTDVVIPELPAGVEPWVVTLDGRAVATPFGNLLVVPGETLAHAVAGEWLAQEDRIKPALMPLMTLCTTAVDIVPRIRDKTVNDCVKFLSTDSVCFFAEREGEPGLREMQEECFLPIIDWFEARFGVKMVTNLSRADLGISFMQPDSVRSKVREAFVQLNDWELSGLDKASGEAKSTAIASMLCAGELSPKQALDACKTEERYQMERWGHIPHWHGIDQGLTQVMLSSAAFYSACLKEQGMSKLGQMKN